MTTLPGFFVYILKCSDDSYYVGHTDDIELRFSQHKNAALGGYTATRLPVQIVFVQSFGSRDEAFVAERKIKKWSRKKKEALINGNMEQLGEYSKKQFKK